MSHKYCDKVNWSEISLLKNLATMEKKEKSEKIS